MTQAGAKMRLVGEDNILASTSKGRTSHVDAERQHHEMVPELDLPQHNAYYTQQVQFLC